jgi:hypothetical protein
MEKTGCFQIKVLLATKAHKGGACCRELADMIGKHERDRPPTPNKVDTTAKRLVQRGLLERRSIYVIGKAGERIGRIIYSLTQKGAVDLQDEMGTLCGLAGILGVVHYPKSRPPDAHADFTKNIRNDVEPMLPFMPEQRPQVHARAEM